MLRREQIKHFRKVHILQPVTCGSHFWACQFSLTLGHVRCSEVATEESTDTQALIIAVACSVTHCMIFNNTFLIYS